MKKWDITLAEDRRIYLYDVPFRAGEKVRVTIEPLAQLIPQEDEPELSDEYTESPSLYSLLNAVKDRVTFLKFVEALAAEKRDESEIDANPEWGAGPLGWQWTRTEDYLDAAVNWAIDAEGTERGITDKPTWRNFAHFLYAGKIYE